jgi:hypothetical protein
MRAAHSASHSPNIRFNPDGFAADLGIMLKDSSLMEISGIRDAPLCIVMNAEIPSSRWHTGMY